MKKKKKSFSTTKKTHKSGSGISSNSFSAPQNKPFRQEYHQKRTVFNLNCTNKLLNLVIYLLTNLFTTTSKFTNFTASASGNHLKSTVTYKNPPFLYIYIYIYIHTHQETRHRRKQRNARENNERHKNSTKHCNTCMRNCFQTRERAGDARPAERHTKKSSEGSRRCRICGTYSEGDELVCLFCGGLVDAPVESDSGDSNPDGWRFSFSRSFFSLFFFLLLVLLIVALLLLAG